METLYLETNGLLERIHGNLSNLERAENEQHANDLGKLVADQLAKINLNCDQLHVYVNREPVHKRQHAKFRVDQITYDCQHLQVIAQTRWKLEVMDTLETPANDASLQSLQQKLNVRWRQQRDRAELLARNYAPNDSTSLYLEDNELQHNDRLIGTHKHVDSLIDQGHAILDNMRFQHASLKGVKRKVLDVANTLGLSNTVMRLIERRTAQDKLVLFGGMFVSAVIMFLFYRWLRW